MEKLKTEEADVNEIELSEDITALGSLLSALNQAKSVGETNEVLARLEKKK